MTERARAARWIGGWILTLLLLTCWWSYRPTWLGGSSSFLVVSGHSMDGTYAEGDFVVAKARGAYATGDVVGFQVPDGEPGAGMLVVHRIVAHSTDGGLITQGDANAEPDPWRLSPADVRGEVALRVPAAGTALGMVKSPLALAAIAGALGAWVALGVGSSEEPKRRSERQRPPVGAAV